MNRPAKRELVYIIKNHNKNPQKVNHVIEVVRNSGGIEYARDKMNGFRDEALSILSTFKSDEMKNALEELVRFTTDRKH